MKKAQEGHVHSLSLPAVSQLHQSRTSETEALECLFGGRGGERSSRYWRGL